MTRSKPVVPVKQTDEVWYRADVIECPKCGHLQQDYINKSEQSFSGCREYYRSQCEICGFNGWVPEKAYGGICDD